MATHPPERPITDQAEQIHAWSENERHSVGTTESLSISASLSTDSASTEDHLETTRRTAASRYGTIVSSDLLSPLRSAEGSIRMLSEHERRLVSILAGSRARIATQPQSGCAERRSHQDMEVALDPEIPVGFYNPEPVTVSFPPNPLTELISTISQYPPSPFDELVAAVSESPAERWRRSGPPPPPERFRVRVASVGRPHRATKRNYDYFEDLSAALDRQRRG